MDSKGESKGKRERFACRCLWILANIFLGQPNKTKQSLSAHHRSRLLVCHVAVRHYHPPDRFHTERKSLFRSKGFPYLSMSCL